MDLYSEPLASVHEAVLPPPPPPPWVADTSLKCPYIATYTTDNNQHDNMTIESCVPDYNIVLAHTGICLF